MSSQSDPLGHVRTLAWSIDDQPLGWQYSGGPYANSGTVSAQYDSLYPRLISSQNQVSTTTYQYHPAGILGAGQVASRNVQYNLSNGISTQHQIAYAYDALGRVTTRTLDGQFVSSYEYDQIGRLHSEQNLLGKFVMSYLGQTSQPTGQALQGQPWRVSYAWEENAKDRALSQIGFGGYQGQFEALDAASPLGYLVSAQEPFAQMWRATPVSWDGQLNYSFNALGQVVTSQQGSDHHHYSYDPSGRLIQDLRTLNTQMLGSYGYDEADNLTMLDDDSGLSHFTHDSGNAVVEQSGDMVQRWVVDAAGQTREDAWNYYRWDSAGQLLGVKNKYSGLRTDFERDAQGRLIGSVSATERQAYLWCDEYTPCARVNAHGQIDALYYGQGEISAAAPYHRYYARDHLGSVRAVVDARGEVIGRQDYSAYGSVVAQSGLMPSVGYAGMWQHHDSGINLTWYRGYQPAAGRWLSRDPIEESGGLNLYGYVGGDPISFVDPLGLVTYMCTQPLHSLGAVGRMLYSPASNPFYHQFIGIIRPDGEVITGGQDRALGPWGPGKPSEGDGAIGSGAECKKLEDDNECIEKCLMGNFTSPRPRYSLALQGLIGGQNCQGWANGTLAQCQASCKGKR